MAQLWLFGVLLTVLRIVEPSHFSGGTISWKPKTIGTVSECFVGGVGVGGGGGGGVGGERGMTGTANVINCYLGCYWLLFSGASLSSIRLDTMGIPV